MSLFVTARGEFPQNGDSNIPIIRSSHTCKPVQTILQKSRAPRIARGAWFRVLPHSHLANLLTPPRPPPSTAVVSLICYKKHRRLYPSHKPIGRCLTTRTRYQVLDRVHFQRSHEYVLCSTAYLLLHRQPYALTQGN